MSKLTKIKYSLIVMVFVTVMSTSSVAIRADTAPIVPIEELEDKFSPSTYNDWDYYILPPGTFFSGVIYGGSSGVSADTRYTDVQTNDYTHFGTALTRGNAPSSTILKDDFRSSNHDFVNDTDYPRAVRIKSEKNPEFVQSQKSILSLHEDYSTTFFAEGMEFYSGFFNTSGPYFLDIEVSNSKVMGAIFFDSEFPTGGYTFGDPEMKMTYPVIPKAPGLQEFMLFTNVSTLVTVTPHEWSFPTWFPSLEVNSIFSEDFDQGETWVKDESNDQLIQEDNTMFSLRLFNFSVVEDQFYRINTAFAMDEVKPGLLSTPPLTSLLGNNFEVISGSMDQDGLIIRAVETVEITLIMYSPGEAHGSYSIFYQEMPPLSVAETSPLTFNEDLTLEYELFYTFTIPTSIIRVNSTGPFDYDIYIEGSDPGDWVKKSDENFIGGTWRYLPAGTYAVEIKSYTVGDEIRFNSVPVTVPSALPLSVHQESIFAIELPLTKNRINFLNISTDDHINQSIEYNIDMLSKYNELVTVTSGSSVTLGNLQTNGAWDEYPGATNDTTIREFLPTREYEAPILLIYPTGATNISDPITVFDGSIKITVDEAPDQSYTYKTFWSFYHAFSGTGFAGVFVPKPTISSTTSYTINSDSTIDNDQIIGIPLNLDPNTIYNVTATLTGNYSTTTSLNATFQVPFVVMGGNLKSLKIFGTYASGSDDFRAWQTSLILTVSEMNYIYFDLQRGGGADPYYNATLQVSVVDINAKNMEFSLNQEYNETASDYEVKSSGLLVKEIKPSEMKKATPGFELSLVFIALVISSVFAAKKRRNR